MRRRILAATAGVVLFMLLAALFPHGAGMLTRHMTLHIGLMSILAPALALLFTTPANRKQDSGRLLSATLLQLCLFLAWHSPAGMSLGMSSDAVQLAMHATLLFGAVWFWRNVYLSARSSPWWTIGALLITGKIFCLVAALLVFAPRIVYPAMSAIAADQQLAGLLMLVACPMTYILASTIVVSRWLWSSLGTSHRISHPQV